MTQLSEADCNLQFVGTILPAAIAREMTEGISEHCGVLYNSGAGGKGSP